MTHEPGTEIATLALHRQLELLDADEQMLSVAIAFAGNAKQIVVSDMPSYEGANAMLREVATLTTKIEADRKAKKAPILAAGRELDAQYADADRNLKEARMAVEQQTRSFRNAEEAKRREAAQRAEELAEKERIRLQRLADKAAERGDVAKAAEFEDRAEHMAEAVNVPVAPMPKSEGVNTRENWTFQIVDEDAIPRKYMTPDLKAIGAIGKALKSRAEIPGVRFWNDESTVIRRL